MRRAYADLASHLRSAALGLPRACREFGMFDA